MFTLAYQIMSLIILQFYFSITFNTIMRMSTHMVQVKFFNRNM